MWGNAITCAINKMKVNQAILDNFCWLHGVRTLPDHPHIEFDDGKKLIQFHWTLMMQSFQGGYSATAALIRSFARTVQLQK